MLEFCPYEGEGKEFRKIDLNNMAYEMIFRVGYDFEVLKNTTAETILETYVSKGVDKRLEQHYKDEKEHFMFHEGNYTNGNVNQLDEFIKKLNEINEKEKEKLMSASVIVECKESRDCKNHYKIVTRSEQEEVYAVIVPCCPNCHKKIPEGWMDAKGFYPFSFLGISGGGKTTYLLSLMNKNWEAIRDAFPNRKYVITGAHVAGDEWYKKVESDSKEMCENGQCPKNTPKGYLVSPIFVKIRKKENNEYIILGFYDNSGEILQDMNALDDKTGMLPKMYGFIYCIDPEQTNIGSNLNYRRELNKIASSYNNSILSIDEQGEFQQKNANNEKKGKDLLQNSTAKRINPREMINKLDQLYENMHVSGRKEEQYVFGTIIKCDLLENICPDTTGNVFLRGAIRDLTNDDTMECRQRIVKNYLTKESIFEEDVLKQLSDFKGETIHFVSSLGCDTVEETSNGERRYKLIARYDPIRVAEPVMYGLKKIMDELGWEW